MKAPDHKAVLPHCPTRVAQKPVNNPIVSFNHFDSVELHGSSSSSNGFIIKATDQKATVSEQYDNKHFVIFRRGLYECQKEVAMADFYKLLMGRAPDIKIVKDLRNADQIVNEAMKDAYAPHDGQPKYHVASRAIKGFKEGFPNDIKDKPIQGLASIYAIAYFFGDSDLHTGNFGHRKTSRGYQFYKIDNSGALDWDLIKQPIDADSIKNILTYDHNIQAPNDDVVNSKAFKKELRQALLTIANTHFDTIEKIFRKHITENGLDEMTFLHRSFALSGLMDEAQLNEEKAFLSSAKKSDYSVDKLVELIKQRHTQLRNVLNVEAQAHSKITSKRF